MKALTVLQLKFLIRKVYKKNDDSVIFADTMENLFEHFGDDYYKESSCSPYELTNVNRFWCPPDQRRELLANMDWNDASVRPPKDGRYIVCGLHEFIPDHCGVQNAYWQTQIATWSDKYGWSTKVKFWMNLPEPPAIYKDDKKTRPVG